jgi:hypothetical protein
MQQHNNNIIIIIIRRGRSKTTKESVDGRKFGCKCKMLSIGSYDDVEPYLKLQVHFNEILLSISGSWRLFMKFTEQKKTTHWGCRKIILSNFICEITNLGKIVMINIDGQKNKISNTDFLFLVSMMTTNIRKLGKHMNVRIFTVVWQKLICISNICFAIRFVTALANYVINPSKAV